MRFVSLVSVGLFLAVALLSGASTAAQEATPGAIPPVAPLEVLFVQSFGVGRLEPAAEPGTATLTLQQPVGETIYFADRPYRVAGTLVAEDFLQLLAQDVADPLNAALIFNQPEGDRVVILKLLDGTVDAAGTVRYDVRVLARPFGAYPGDPSAYPTDMMRSAWLLSELTGMIDFGSSHLFIDSKCVPPRWLHNCVSCWSGRITVDCVPIARRPPEGGQT